MTSRPTGSEVDRVYRVADLVADRAAGRATRRADGRNVAPVSAPSPRPGPPPDHVQASTVAPAPSGPVGASARTPLPPRPEARPRIVQDPVILGLTRHSRSRLGSRLFTWFFVFVYLLIVIQLIWSLLKG